MSFNKPNTIFQNQLTKFIKDGSSVQESNFSTVGKGNIFTHNTSNKAYLPQSSFYSIINGALITANKRTRYILNKDSTDFSVTLNKEVNWNNKGQGYSFSYQNPVTQLLDNSKSIVGYITLDGLIYLTKDLESLFFNKLTATQDSNGLKILNKNNYGLYINNNNIVYRGNNNTNTWESLHSIQIEEVIKFSNSVPSPKSPFWFNTITDELYVCENLESGNYKLANDFTNMNINGGEF